MVGVTGAARTPLLTVEHLSAAGLERAPARVLAVTFPTGMAFECLLGLDFFRGHRLCLDMEAHVLEIEATAAG
jgi:hypothetical protein